MVVGFSRLRDKKVEKVGMVALYKGRVKFLGFRGAGALLATLKDGFTVDGKVLSPADGRAYLEALPRRYRGDYLRAYLQTIGR
jgi:hypothetical protein